jgi:glycosyltransferase involved in cell wall biosynthesis
MAIIDKKYTNTNSVFIVSEFVFKSQNSTGYYWSKIINKLANDGLSPKVVYPNYKINNDILCEQCHKIPIKPSVFEKKTLITKVVSQLSLSYRFLITLIRLVKRNDVVLSGTNPSLSLFFLYILKRVIGFKWILLVYDVFPDNLIPSGILSTKRSILYRVLNRVYRAVYSSPDRLIVIGCDMHNIMSKKVKVKENIILINNWADESEVFPSNKSDFLLNRGINIQEGSVVFQFLGNIGRLQGIDNLLQSIKLIKNKKTVFLFFGNGSYLYKLKEFIKDNHNINIFYGGEVQENDRNFCLSSCDVAFVTLDSGMYGLGVPSKAYFSMGVNKPILTVMDVNSEIAKVVTENQIGWYCEPNKPEELANLIDKISEGNWSNDIKSSREVLINKYSQTRSLDMFSNTVKDALNISH